MDAELEHTLKEARRHRDEALARLAPRRRAERRELEALALELGALSRTQGDLERRRAAAVREAAVLAPQVEVLEAKGLSTLRRWWARAGEPLVFATLLLTACLAVGLSPSRGAAVLMVGAAAVVGLLVGSLVRR